MRIFSFIIFSYFLFFSLPLANATDPGESIEIIREKNLVVDLYLIGLSASGNTLNAVEFTWIPKSLQEGCLGQSYEVCRKIRNVQMSSELPRRVLDSWVVDSQVDRFPQSKSILEKLSQVKFVRDLMVNVSGELKIEDVLPEYKVHAKIHWELWPNGENFTVLEVYP